MFLLFCMLGGPSSFFYIQDISHFPPFGICQREGRRPVIGRSVDIKIKGSCDSRVQGVLVSQMKSELHQETHIRPDETASQTPHVDPDTGHFQQPM